MDTKEEIISLVKSMLNMLDIEASVVAVVVNGYIRIDTDRCSNNNNCIFTALGMDSSQAEEYVKGIVGYMCLGLWPHVGSLEDLSKVVHKLYQDVCTKVQKSRKVSPLKIDDDILDRINGFKIETIKLPTIGDLNFKY